MTPGSEWRSSGDDQEDQDLDLDLERDLEIQCFHENEDDQDDEEMLICMTDHLESSLRLLGLGLRRLGDLDRDLRIQCHQVCQQG